MEHVKIKDLYYTYERSDGEKIEALKGLDLTVHAGEFIAILGHNGSGKSTLARLLNGLLEPLSGDVEVMGMNTKDSAKIFDIRRALGLVFQNPDNQMVATVVEEDVAFGPENLGLPSEEIVRRVDHALELVEMERERLRAPHLLSGGQKQRVAIAGILAIDPAIIVLDEPTAMLDPIGRREIMRTLKRLHEEEKKTVILITHFMEEAILADRVVVLSDGKLMMEGTPREIFARTEELTELALDVPVVTKIAHLLHEDGFTDMPVALTVEELVNAL